MKKIISLSVLLFLLLSSCAVFAGGSKEKAAPVVKESAPAAVVAPAQEVKPAAAPAAVAPAATPASAPAVEAPKPEKKYLPYLIAADKSVSIASLSDLYADALHGEIAVPENLKDEVAASYPEIAKNLVAVPSAEDAEKAVKEGSFLVALLPQSYDAELDVLSLEL